MADLRSVIYGSNTFTIPTYDDSALSARVTANETAITAQDARIAALEALLADHADVRLTLTGEGGTETAYDVLGKEYITPPSTMFDLAPGIYDENGNKIAELNDVYRVGGIELENPGEFSVQLVSFDIGALPTSAKGIVFTREWWGRDIVFDGIFNSDDTKAVFYNAVGSPLEWIVLPDSVTYIKFSGSFSDNTDLFNTIYYNGEATGAPWGQTSATINTSGTPVPWTE